MNDFSKNIELQSMNSLLGSRANELIRNSQKNSEKLTESERNKFAKVSRGFEAMFVNMLLKEMKSSLNNEQDSEFGGPLLEYTDMLFAEQISNQGKGIGIAEKVYEFLTGEELPSQRIIQNSYQADTDIHSIRPTRGINPTDLMNKNDYISAKKVNDSPSLISGNFMNRVKDRIEIYETIINEASDKYGIPSELIKAVITAESAGRNIAKSKVGAKGLMQLMDATAKELGVTDSFDPLQNINGGTLYLRRMLDKFNNDRNLALAAYNAGPGNVEKYGGIPPFKETENYIIKVNKYLNLYLNEKSDKQELML
ncbi:MAG: transglycosylase SLT domain-containing protein [Candidatus Kapaibacterium sp.]|jgi:soluble lytic murein transglycosylase-like protein|nr:transglycosylase SLT domain-containing protein [Candidatus Kapabacteria bacterium]